MRYRLTILVLLLTVRPLYAQKAPELGYVFPPSIQAGTTTTVQLGGYDFTPDMHFFVQDSRVKLTNIGTLGSFIIPKPPYWFGPRGGTTAFPIPREVSARMTVPKNISPGLNRWQVANANGSSSFAMFYVDDGPQLIENRDREKPQVLKSLPIAISGRISKIAEVDRYQLTAAKDGPVTVELFARRLGSNFHGLIEIRDNSGKILADIADTEGLDAAVTFTAKAGQSYLVSLHDVDFRGNQAYAYRLALTAGPRVVTTIPAAGRRGETRMVEFIGYGVASGQAKLESVKRKVMFPKNLQQSELRYRLQTPFGTTPPLNIPLSNLNEITQPNQKSNTPIPLAIPTAITSRLMRSSKANSYTFSAKKGDVWKIRCQSRAIGTRLDLSLTIRDTKGKQLATNDDLPGTPDAGLDFKAPVDGVYICLVSDLSGRLVSPSAVFRLAISHATSGFELSAPQQLNIPLAEKASLTVKVIRIADFKGEIELTIEGLPAGMTAPKLLKIPAGKKSAKIPIQSAKNASSLAGYVRIAGKAKIDGKTVTHPVLASGSGNLCPRNPRLNWTSSILLATTMKPPFSLELVDRNRQRAVHRGTTYRAEFVIQRNEGFTGEVMLQMASKQGRHRQGINAPVITAKPRESRVLYPCFMPEWLETDRTTRMVVMGVAKVADPTGKLRYLTNPSKARITMILEGALLKVSQQTKELTIRPGGSFEIPIRVSRSAKLKLPVKVELVIPKELTSLVQCSPLILQPGQTNASLQVQTQKNAKLNARWKFHVKATALENGKWPVVSQTHVEVQFE